MFDADTIGDLRKLNIFLKSDKFSLPSRDSLRQQLTDRGEIKKAVLMSGPDLEQFTGNRPVVAVDGSRLEYGSFYPYYIILMKSLAKSTRACDQGDSVIDSQLLTPVNSVFFNQVEEYSQKQHVSIDEAYRNLLKQSLAQMEVKTALKAMQEFNPGVLLMDGGFIRII